MAKIRTLVCYVANKDMSLMSYNDDWLDAFRCDNRLEVYAANLATEPFWRLAPKILSYELIVFLHSTNSNGIAITNKVQSALKWRRGKLIFFVGNEFKLMPEKIALINSLETDWVASQYTQEKAEWLYAECSKSKKISMAHALNPESFKSLVPQDKREIDVGVRAFRYQWYLGDRDREIIINYFSDSTRLGNLKCDISFDPNQRMDRQGWAAFLNSCKGTISTEAGGALLERDDSTRLKVMQYTDTHPNATFDEVYDLFFRNHKSPLTGKCISSRHLDAVGTKTCQIMFPGEFNGVLRADEHYIALNRDFSNIAEVLERFLDTRFRTQLVDRTYDYVRAEHTHQHRIDRLIKSVCA